MALPLGRACHASLEILYLKLDESALSDATASAFAAMLGRCTRLETVQLGCRDCGLTPVGCQFLTTALGTLIRQYQLKNLTLNMSYNAALGRRPRCCGWERLLDIRGNLDLLLAGVGLGNRGLAQLSRGGGGGWPPPSRGPHRMLLDLQDNGLGDGCGRALVALLNQRLCHEVRWNLSHNWLGDAAVAQMAVALVRHQHPPWFGVNLESNQIGYFGAHCLKGMLSERLDHTRWLRVRLGVQWPPRASASGEHQQMVHAALRDASGQAVRDYEKWFPEVRGVGMAA